MEKSARVATAMLRFSKSTGPPHNHVTVELMKSLADALFDVDAVKNLRASVLMATGKSFCAGADFAARASVGASGEGGVNELYVESVRLFSAILP